jgi:hypothetical protein
VSDHPVEDPVAESLSWDVAPPAVVGGLEPTTPLLAMIFGAFRTVTADAN